MWTDGEVAKDKVLASRWMRQFAHTWRHFAFWVPWVRKGQACNWCPSIGQALCLLGPLGEEGQACNWCPSIGQALCLLGPSGEEGQACNWYPLLGRQALCPSISAAIELSRQATVPFY